MLFTPPLPSHHAFSQVSATLLRLIPTLTKPAPIGLTSSHQGFSETQHKHTHIYPCRYFLHVHHTRIRVSTCSSTTRAAVVFVVLGPLLSELLCKGTSVSPLPAPTKSAIAKTTHEPQSLFYLCHADMQTSQCWHLKTFRFSVSVFFLS